MGLQFYLLKGFIYLTSPLLFFQGKQIRKKIPTLPEAKTPQGATLSNDYIGNKHVIFLGESTFAGVGVEYHEDGIPGKFAQLLSSNLKSNISWRVYARSGYTAKLVRTKLLPKIKESHADLIMIGLGGNDAFTLNGISSWTNHIQLLIEVIRAKFPHTPICFTNVPPIKSFPAFTSLIQFTIGNYVNFLSKALNEVTAKFENVYSDPRILKPEEWLEKFEEAKDMKAFFSDGVHPSQLTYQVWAEEMIHFINEKNILG